MLKDVRFERIKKPDINFSFYSLFQLKLYLS